MTLSTSILKMRNDLATRSPAYAHGGRELSRGGRAGWERGGGGGTAYSGRGGLFEYFTGAEDKREVMVACDTRVGPSPGCDILPP